MTVRLPDFTVPKVEDKMMVNGKARQHVKARRQGSHPTGNHAIMKKWQTLKRFGIPALFFAGCQCSLPGRAEIGFDWPGPTLTVARSGADVTLSWPISTDPLYVLEFSTEAGSWCELGAAPVSVNKCWQVLVPASRAQCWFRLHRPRWTQLKILR